MTMPSRIYAAKQFMTIKEPDEEMLACMAVPFEIPLLASTAESYIRSDIAEELARALDHSMEWVASTATRIKLQKVLDEYRAITP